MLDAYKQLKDAGRRSKTNIQSQLALKWHIPFFFLVSANMYAVIIKAQRKLKLFNRQKCEVRAHHFVVRVKHADMLHVVWFSAGNIEWNGRKSREAQHVGVRRMHSEFRTRKVTRRSPASHETSEWVHCLWSWCVTLRNHPPMWVKLMVIGCCTRFICCRTFSVVIWSNREKRVSIEGSVQR